MFQNNYTPSKTSLTFTIKAKQHSAKQQQTIRQQFNQFIQSLYNNNRIKIQPYQHLFPFIDQWEIKELLFSKKKYSNSLLLIKDIQFIKLAKLDLRDCNILSLQLLSTISMPTLNHLQLDDNQLVSLKSLRKCNFNLLSLKISNNYLTQLDTLYQANFDLQQLALQFLPDRLMINSLTFLIKLKSNILQTCRALNKDRIPQKKTQQSIRKKMIKSNFDLRTYVKVRFI